MYRSLVSVMLPLAGFVCLHAVCRADDTADRTKLAGTWNLDGGAGTTWTLQEINTGVHLIYARGAEKLADFECNTTGKECSVRMDGHGVKVSLYYNGPRLVMLETRGDTVVKWRFGLASDSGELEVETIPIAPGGATETLHFKRADVQASSR